MSSEPHPLPSTDVSQCEADGQYYRRVLHELIELGMGLARSLPVAAPGEQPVASGEAPGAVASVAFERIARAVRRTVGLARRLNDPVTGREGVAEQRRVVARRRVLRAVEDAIHQEWTDPEREDLESELRERMEGPELDDDLDHRPVAEIIADICRDLGLGARPGVVGWKRRTPADVAALCVRAAGVRREAAVGVDGEGPGAGARVRLVGPTRDG